MPQIIYPPINKMIWDKRVFDLRTAIVTDLKSSFRKETDNAIPGQLQPIVVLPLENGNFKLVIGRHRYQAAKENYKEVPNYVHHFCGEAIPEGTIAAVDARDMPLQALLDMEITENVIRMDLAWDEKIRALALLHQLEEEAFEEKKEAGLVPAEAVYTASATARKLADASRGNEGTIANKLSQALIVAQHLDDPDIAKAESARSAWNKVKEKAHAAAALVETDYSGETPHTLIEDDCADVMADWLDDPLKSPPKFNVILADPPYGIGADTYDNMALHKYDDSWENAELVYGAICGYGYNLTDERASMALFTSPCKWHKVRDIAEEAGWTVWPRPIIWVKSNEGMRPWGQTGFAYTYETILFATKGGKGLARTMNDVMQFYRPHHSMREHAAAKPIALYEHLLKHMCIPGDTVLDPCVGSGTSFKAGYLAKVKVTGIENNPTTALVARKNLHWQVAEDRPVDEQLTPSDTLDDL